MKIRERDKLIKEEQLERERVRTEMENYLGDLYKALVENHEEYADLLGCAVHYSSDFLEYESEFWSRVLISACTTFGLKHHPNSQELYWSCIEVLRCLKELNCQGRNLWEKVWGMAHFLLDELVHEYPHMEPTEVLGVFTHWPEFPEFQ